MKAALVLLALGVAMLIAPAHSDPGHPRAAEGYAERLVGAGILELPPSSGSTLELPTIVRDGRRRAEVGLLDVALALPGAVFAHAVSRRAEAIVSAWRTIGGVLLPAILFAMIGVVFCARLYRKRGLGLAPSVVCTLALLFCTNLLLGARRADASLAATLALLLLLDELGQGEEPRARHFLQVGILGATLIIAQPAYAICALALALFDLIRRRVRGGKNVLPAFLAITPLVVAIIVVRSWDAAIALSPEPSLARVHALYGLLLSPGRSLFVYSPLALLGLVGFPRLWARDRRRAQAIAIAVTGALIAIAARADWHGDPSFGPPQLLPLVPLFVEPAVFALEAGTAWRVTFAAATIAGLLIQLLGLGVRVEAWPRLMDEVRVVTGAPGWFLDPASDLEFVPQLSPVAGHALLLRARWGRPMTGLPPFALVVGSDQEAPAKGQGLESTWPAIWTRFDKTLCRPNLMATEAPRGVVRAQLVLAFLLLAAGLVQFLRSDPWRSRWRRG